LHTGGSTCGDTSTKSRRASEAFCIASSVLTTHKLLPFSSINLTVEEVINSFMRNFGPLVDSWALLFFL